MERAVRAVLRGAGDGDVGGAALAVAAAAAAAALVWAWRASSPLPNRRVRHRVGAGADADDDARSVEGKVADMRRAFEDANWKQSRDADFRGQQVSVRPGGARTPLSD